MDTADKVRAIPISKLSSRLFLLVKRGEREKGGRGGGMANLGYWMERKT
jgi:hypothetical protein